MTASDSVYRCTQAQRKLVDSFICFVRFAIVKLHTFGQDGVSLLASVCFSVGVLNFFSCVLESLCIVPCATVVQRFLFHEDVGTM